jgi:hypothetical protein
VEIADLHHFGPEGSPNAPDGWAPFPRLAAKAKDTSDAATTTTETQILT